MRRKLTDALVFMGEKKDRNFPSECLKLFLAMAEGDGFLNVREAWQRLLPGDYYTVTVDKHDSGVKLAVNSKQYSLIYKETQEKRQKSVHS